MHKMAEKIHLFLCIFCAIFAQGIIGTFLENDLRNSNDSLVREKRVINRVPGQDVPFPSAYSTYTVNIKVANRVHCMGTILSLKTVITAARCIIINLSLYTVFAGSTDTRRGTIHNVREILHHGNHSVPGQSRLQTGIALLYVDPRFEPQRNNIDIISGIDLHVGPLLQGMEGTVRGWGSYYFGGACQTQNKGRLREIEVPIISHRDCVNSLRGFFDITDEYFCTHDVNKQCGYTDSGAGFVIENSLAGIYLGLIETGNDSHLKPDVFIMLQHSDYHQWILRNIKH